MNAPASAANGRRPPILFLSHAGVDTVAARELKRRLEVSPDARAAGLKIWFDKEDLPPGSDWQERLEVAITQGSTAFAVYVGSNGVVTWVRREVRLALSRATTEADYLFVPIIADAAGGSKLLPPFARQHQIVRDPLKDTDQLQALLRAILNPGPEAPTVLIDEPYVGLRAMDEGEADRFFGREAELDELVERLRGRRLLALIADSGTGKSSLVRAGLIPAWRGHELARPDRTEPDKAVWHVVVMRPGANPIEELAKGVTVAATRPENSENDKAGYRSRIKVVPAGGPADDSVLRETAYALQCGFPPESTETLLVVDQFEELYTHASPADRAAFVDLLLYLSDPVRCALSFRVVLTMRADYANRLNDFPALQAALDGDKGEFRLKGMSDEGLARVVHEPLRLAGHRDREERDRLLTAIRQDLDRRPGDTALLAVALNRVWTERDRNRPDALLAVYQKIGRIAGALASAADRTVSRLSEQERALSPGLWARLVQPSNGRDAVRRVAQLSEFGDSRQMLARRLATDESGRLLLASESAVEIAHEALFAQWGVLQDFVRENGDDLRRLGRLMDAALGWAALAAGPGRKSITSVLKTILGWKPPPSANLEYLETGPDLAAFEHLAKVHPDWLSDAEKRFVEESAAEAKRLKSNARWETNAIVGAAFGAAVATVVVSVLLVLVARNAESLAIAKDLADQKTKEAEAQTQKAEAETLKAEAETVKAEAQARAAAISESRALAALSTNALNAGDSLAALKLAIAAWPRNAGDKARPMLRTTLDAMSAAIAAPPLAAPVLQGVALLDPSGNTAITTGYDRTIQFIDLKTGADIGKRFKHENLNDGAFSPDGKRFVSVGGNMVRLWNIPDGVILIKEFPFAQVSRSVFTADGERLVVWSELGEVQLRDGMGNPLRSFTTSTPLNGVDFSPGGTRLVILTENAFRLVDAKSARDVATEELSPLAEGGSRFVNGVGMRFTSNDAHLAVKQRSDAIRLWEASSGQRTTVDLSLANVDDFVFSPDGKRLLAWSREGAATLWDIGVPLKDVPRPLVGSGEGRLKVRQAVFSNDGTRLVTWDENGQGHLWDPSSGESMADLGEDKLQEILFSGGGRQLITLSGAGVVRLWDLNGSRVDSESLDHPDVKKVTLSPDGRWIATHSDSETRVWLLRNGRFVGQPLRHGKPESTAFLDGGKRLAVGDAARTLRQWDLSGVTYVGADSSAAQDLVLSSNGERAATWSETEVRVWGTKNGEAVSPPFKDSNVTDVRFSADGKYLSTLSRNGSVHVWDVADPSANGITLGVQDASAVRWAPEGELLATRSRDGVVRLWNATGTRIGSDMEGPKNTFAGPDGIRFLAGGRRLIVWSAGALYLWDVPTGKPVGNPLAHPKMTEISFPLDGRRFVTWSSPGQWARGAPKDAHAVIWDAMEAASVGKPIVLQDLRSLDLSPDGTRIATRSELGEARLWDASTGNPVGADTPLSMMARSVSFSGSGDALRLIAISDNDQVQIWNPVNRAPTGGPVIHVNVRSAVILAVDGNPVLATISDEDVRFWSLPGGAAMGAPLPHEGVAEAWISPDGRRILTKGREQIRLWDAGTFKLIMSHLPPDILEGRPEALTASTAAVVDLIPGPNGVVRLARRLPTGSHLADIACQHLPKDMRETGSLRKRYRIDIAGPLCAETPPQPDWTKVEADDPAGP